MCVRGDAYRVVLSLDSSHWDSFGVDVNLP
jgi:hypothetical protein